MSRDERDDGGGHDPARTTQHPAPEWAELSDLDDGAGSGADDAGRHRVGPDPDEPHGGGPGDGGPGNGERRDDGPDDGGLHYGGPEYGGQPEYGGHAAPPAPGRAGDSGYGDAPRRPGFDPSPPGRHGGGPDHDPNASPGGEHGAGYASGGPGSGGPGPGGPGPGVGPAGEPGSGRRADGPGPSGRGLHEAPPGQPFPPGRDPRHGVPAPSGRPDSAGPPEGPGGGPPGGYGDPAGPGRPGDGQHGGDRDPGPAATSAPPGQAGAGAPGGTGTAGEEPVRVMRQHRADSFRDRWDAVQGTFVDRPREAVGQADELVGDLLEELSWMFRNQRADLEQSWDDEEGSTENLRVALRRYRELFDRLLSM